MKVGGGRNDGVGFALGAGVELVLPDVVGALAVGRLPARAALVGHVHRPIPQVEAFDGEERGC